MYTHTDRLEIVIFGKFLRQILLLAGCTAAGPLGSYRQTDADPLSLGDRVVLLAWNS